MKILQIVGYKNTGKTTLINELIRICNDNHIKVSTIKHHGHGDEISMDHTEIDSLSFITTGANESIVLGNEYIERISKKSATLNQIIANDLSCEVDIVLVEGFKEEDYPKVLLTSSSESMKQHLTHCVYELDAFNQDEKSRFIAWFKGWIDKEEA
ncbi:molybdopterin-guanine dinucleotide biosynthesis protein B [Mammaliicoccus stepanovicii]|uniref:MobB n=1 Tax=Mammaliicoccus stepanovicii TaxID=643214 RepID=A0A239YI31_9STAP|nr:molybdopterin-guanine dinucleotide biosynthesis protein B [Mammaliicoccus stepanovicii]PNZ77895.1 molybdopterin-guanine dinucleotide biosynthesis protein B [Mammaliicoccus stepanovicii]GGI40963.1 molybdopterin-guanine dinucleotide biosynthesis protein B [Mammaliicoccus stepanovicii]SNV58931.1 MobB [Mammaliicoccus stepanovicii]